MTSTGNLVFWIWETIKLNSIWSMNSEIKLYREKGFSTTHGSA